MIADWKVIYDSHTFFNNAILNGTYVENSQSSEHKKRYQSGGFIREVQSTDTIRKIFDF